MCYLFQRIALYVLRTNQFVCEKKKCIFLSFQIDNIDFQPIDVCRKYLKVSSRIHSSLLPVNLPHCLCISHIIINICLLNSTAGKQVHKIQVYFKIY